MTDEYYGDLYLRFADENEANELLADYPGSIDIIGVIHKPTGWMIKSDDGEVPEMAPVPGWHVNTRGPMPEALLPYAVTPEQPVRVWA